MMIDTTEINRSLYEQFVAIFGEYQPIQLTEYQYAPNYSYIFMCVVFCIVVYSMFRLLGGVLGGRRK